MWLFHIATVSDWETARASGRYTTSTRGRTLAEEGFIHASRADQWQGVRERYYADIAEPLVLLVIDSERLTAPVVDEPVPGTDERFPHVYGAIEPAAVTRALPLGTTSAPSAHDPVVRPPASSIATSHRSFLGLFLEEAGFRAGIVLVVLVLATLLGLLAQNVWGDVAALVGMLMVIALGFSAGAVVLRRREQRHRSSPG